LNARALVCIVIDNENTFALEKRGGAIKDLLLVLGDLAFGNARKFECELRELTDLGAAAYRAAERAHCALTVSESEARACGIARCAKRLEKMRQDFGRNAGTGVVHDHCLPIHRQRERGQRMRRNVMQRILNQIEKCKQINRFVDLEGEIFEHRESDSRAFVLVAEAVFVQRLARCGRCAQIRELFRADGFRADFVKCHRDDAQTALDRQLAVCQVPIQQCNPAL